MPTALIALTPRWNAEFATRSSVAVSAGSVFTTSSKSEADAEGSMSSAEMRGSAWGTVGSASKRSVSCCSEIIRPS